MEKIEIAKTHDFLAGGGEMGERIRNFDWSKNPLGDPINWENSLKTCVRIMLSSTQPIWIGWGKQLIKLYNDAYIDIVRGKHPQALGQPASVVWKDIWKDIEPMLARAMVQDEGTYKESQLLIMERSGYPEETYYTFSYTPVLGDDGNPAGIICYNVADTERIINERSLGTLQQLDTLAQKKSEQEVYEQASKALGTNNRDFPFAVIYKIEHAGHVATPVAWTGIDPKHPQLPAQIDIDKPPADSKNFVTAIRENRIVQVQNNSKWKDIPTGAWDIVPHTFVHIPIKAVHRTLPLAILSIGLNPYRQFDDAYKNFVQLIGDRISLGVNNVIAYEEERKRAESLAELDKAKTIFFSNISHEFRTPLTLMLGTIEEVLNDPKASAETVERMTVSHRNAMRLLRLVNTLLDFSRIESGRQKANYALTDIAGLTKNLAANFRSIIEKAGLKFIVRADSIIQPVYLDRQMWEKIVFNLLSNAFKYTLTGSITLQLYSDPHNAVLEVEDTGSGIPEEELPRMFERFHRVENVIGRTHEGTGIGLSLIKELIQLHGGTITVKSKEGRGSNFIIKIPLGKEHLPAAQTSETPEDFEDALSDSYIDEAVSLLDKAWARRGSPNEFDQKIATVLVVDDNADMREHIESLLHKKFNVVTAANGMEALHKIRAARPTIVVSDIMMPVMDGIQLLTEIKQFRETQSIPVILLTARAGEESRIEGFEIGADDYLVKPFSAKELLSRIKAQIEISQKRNRAETQLKEFLMQAPAAIAVLEGHEHVFTIANQQFARLTGRNENELIGQRVKDVFPELSGQPIYRFFDEVFSSGQPFSQHSFPVTLNINGQPRAGYYDFILQPIKNADGITTGIMSHAVDITETVLAGEKIEQNNAMIRNMYMTAPAFVAVFKGPEHVYELINPYYQSVIGNRDVIGKKLLDALPELKGQGIDTLFDHVYTTGETVIDKESLVMLSRGPGMEPEEAYFHYSFQPIYGESKNITGVLAFGTDVTLQVLARKRIEESEKRFRTMANEAPLFVWLTDEKLQTVFLNKTGLDYFNLSETYDASELSWKNYIHPDDLPMVLHIMHEAGETQQPYTLEMRLKNGVTGEYRWFLDKGTGRYENNKLIGFIGTSLDIHDRKEAENQIRENEKELKLRDQQKDDFILMASHELKTPVTTINGYVQLLLDVKAAVKNGAPADASVFDSGLKTIHKQVGKLTSLISELLDLSRIQKGQLELHKTLLDLGELVSDVVSDVQYTTKQRIGLTIEANEKVYADRDRIMQVILNLLTNAIKYSPDADKIEMRVFTTGKNFAAVSVKDYGIGIDKSDHEKIFERFYRAEGKKEKTFPGFGIGLFIASDIIRRHNGQIMVKSEKNKGSEFTFTLPVAKNPFTPA